MKKRIIITVIGLLILLAILGGIKGLQIKTLISQGESFTLPPETVTTTAVKKDSWEITLDAIGSLEAVEGVVVSAELSGKVTKINFTAGAEVQAGDLLVQQDISSEQAQLRSAEASVVLAKSNLDRSRRLLQQKTVSQSEYDSVAAQYKSAVAAADNIRTNISKKTIRAPFSGRLGVRFINLGEDLREGARIVSLQSLSPIFVNFYLPQWKLNQIKTGLVVRVTTDALPGNAIEGLITTINPEVDSATRNVLSQAVLQNEDEKLLPGMFAKVAVIMPERKSVFTIPATAVLYAPYGDSVFVVEAKKNESGEQGAEEASKIIRQQFVRLGGARGDFVSVVDGLKENEIIVSTGVFKLRNNQDVVIDNRLNPDFVLDPSPEDS